MDIKHKVHEHNDKRTFKMQRLYIRQDKKFISAGWICPDCGVILID